MPEIEHESDCGVNDLTFRDMATDRDCTCGAVLRAKDAEIERLRSFIRSIDGKMICIMGDGDTFIDDGIIVADDIINPQP